MGNDDLLARTTRNARSVQTTIGWIFWDPGAVARYDALGLPGPLGYVAARAAPLAPAGPDAVIAAFGSISPAVIRWAFDLVAERGTTFEAVWAARDEAVLAGLAEHAPAILDPLARLGPELWPVVAQLPMVGRPFAAAHLQSRLVSIEANPRGFVEAETYKGPDRRRRAVDVGDRDRREEEPLILTPKAS